MKQLEFENGQLIITNLLTKKVQKIKLIELTGYRLNGLTLKIELINLQGETMATLYNPFYKELNAFLLKKDLKQIDMDEKYFRWLAV